MNNSCNNKCYTNSSSYIYDGGNLECSGSLKGDTLNLVLAKLDAAICAGITNPVNLVGDVTGEGTYTITTTLATVNPNVGTFGDSTHVPQFTVNEKGLVTSVSNIEIFTTPSISVADISSLQSYSGAADVLVVRDPIRGGTFSYTTASYTPNGGTIFDATGIGTGYWIREYDNLINTNWFGTTTSGSSSANTTIINSILSSGFRSMYIPNSISYDINTLTRNSLNASEIFDENIKGIHFGSGASLRKSANQASHITLKSAITNSPSGMWIQANGSYPFTPDATGVYQAFKLGFEDLDIETLNNTNNYGDATVILNNNGLNGYGCVRYNTTSNGDFQGDFISTEFTFQNSNYRAMSVMNLQPNYSLAGTTDFYNWGGRDRTFWYAGRATTTGDLILVFFRVYQAATTGTTGSTKPVHTSGTVSDGGVSWTYIEDLSQNVSGFRHRPAVIFGDNNTSADSPAIGWNDAAVHFGEDVLFYPNTGINFIDTTKRILNARIEGLGINVPGIKFIVDSATTKNLTMSSNRCVVNNLQIVPTNISKTDGATTQIVTTGNLVGFNDSSATSFTQFLTSAPNTFILTYFTTANTTLVESSNLNLGGNGNITMPANSSALFNMVGVDKAVLVTTSPLGGSGNYIQNTSSPQTANFNITGAGTTGTFTTGQFSITGGSNGDIFYQNSGNFTRKSIGTANQILGVTNAGTTLEYKTITAGTNISVVHGVGSITINNTATAVASVSGTTNRITSTGGTTPVIDISSSYIGQSSLSTLGTITTGAWNATAIGATYGGTSQSTYTTGDILYASASNTLSKLTIGSSNQILTVIAGVPSWQTLTGAGILSLNALTTATQTFAVGTSGTDFTISSSSSTHTFNIPDASATNRGLVTTGTQTFAGAKNFTAGSIIFNATSNVFRTTNGGSNIAAQLLSDLDGSASTSGSQAMVFETASGLGWTLANGTRRILRAAMKVVNATNTAGSETGDLAFYTQSNGTAVTEKWRISSTGLLSNTGAVGTAYIHLKAGTTGVAPFKYTSGTNLTVAENGAKEYDGTDEFITAQGIRQVCMKGMKGSFSQVGAATTVFTVTIGNTQPNSTYNVQVTPTAALSAALFYVTNKTTTSFDVTYLAGLTGSVLFDWIVTQ